MPDRGVAGEPLLSQAIGSGQIRRNPPFSITSSFESRFLLFCQAVVNPNCKRRVKDAVVACLLPPESSPVEAVSQKVGISVATLERWRAAALAANDDNGSPRHWTPAARLEAVIATAAMDEATRSAWCREHGLYPTDLDRWKQDALGGLGEPRDDGAAEAKQERRRIKELERDLHRKDKALAETAALLVLSKKLSAIFRNGEDA